MDTALALEMFEVRVARAGRRFLLLHLVANSSVCISRGQWVVTPTQKEGPFDKPRQQRLMPPSFSPQGRTAKPGLRI